MLVVCLWLAELKIHVSPDTKQILDTFNTFQLELRGPVEMKVTFVKTSLFFHSRSIVEYTGGATGWQGGGAAAP